MGVTSGGLNFKDTVFNGQQRDIESTTTQVENQDVFFLTLLVQTVSNGSGGRFVNNTQDIQTSNGTSILGSLSLRIVEVSWDSDDSVIDLGTQVRFGSFLHLTQDHGGDLFWGKVLGFTLKFNLNLWLTVNIDQLEWEVLHITLHFWVVEVSTDQTLSVENGIRRIHSSLILSSITNQSFSVSESDKRWSGSVTLVVGNNVHTIISKVSNTRVCCT
ncbi:EC1118_1A20_0815p [Saccharomyces cerevisiae EC1118]|uniref:EC1118_1A20_0815p n=1 Tax=Saccharomyces cerevisiae (strain Lalvin EC1118 / Prise de mousse) TaxID=643680 RepID=C8Z3H4_YEAS8|nr:EC1118_1A20_0815p [Saccharomyces cerevisiae EC1118]